MNSRKVRHEVSKSETETETISAGQLRPPYLEARLVLKPAGFYIDGSPEVSGIRLSRVQCEGSWMTRCAASPVLQAGEDVKESGGFSNYKKGCATSQLSIVRWPHCCRRYAIAAHIAMRSASCQRCAAICARTDASLVFMSLGK